MVINIKYRFRKYPKIFMTKSGELWQESFNSKNRYFGFRIKTEKIHCNQLKFRIGKDWVSKKQLNECAYLVDEKIDTGMLPEDLMPF